MKRFSYLLTLLLFSCAVGPKYAPPEVTFSDNWHGNEEDDLTQDVNPKWWDAFGDPTLSFLIEKAATSNYELLALKERILEAKAIKQVVASRLFPQILGDLNASRTYFSKNGPVFVGQSLTSGVSSLTGLPFTLQLPQTQNLFNLLLDTAWEIDLFGKTRRAVKEAEAQVEAQIAEKNGLLLSLLGEITQSYIALRKSQELGLLVEEDLRLLSNQIGIEKKRFFSGYHSAVPLENLEAEIASLESILPQIHAELYQAVYALSALLGEPPETLVPTLLPFKPLLSLPENVGLGLRSNLLRRRPDVQFAERQMAAATEKVGVAVASFFPTITLGADLGLQALKIINLFQSQSKTWSFGGDFNLPIFQGGKLVGNLRASEANLKATAHLYQQTVLNALKEAESSLKNYLSQKTTFNHLQTAVEKKEIVFTIKQQQVQKGLINMTDFLTSERELNHTKQTQVESQAEALKKLVTLYKALGGGWESFEEEGPSSS